MSSILTKFCCIFSCLANGVGGCNVSFIFAKDFISYVSRIAFAMSSLLEIIFVSGDFVATENIFFFLCLSLQIKLSDRHTKKW